MRPLATSRDQFALLSWVAAEFGGGGNLGKKAVQKIVHILEEGLGVNIGYKFSIHMYGAFSRDLAGDIDIASSLDAIKMTFKSDQNSYIIKKGESADRLMEASRKYLELYASQLSYAKSKLSDKSARDLELFSTYIFIMHRENRCTDEAIVDELRRLKPKYDHAEAAKGFAFAKEFMAQATF